MKVRDVWHTRVKMRFSAARRTKLACGRADKKPQAALGNLLWQAWEQRKDSV